MFGLLGLVSIIGTGIQVVKESMEKPIPTENWANKDLYYKDMMDGVPIEKRLKYAEQGRYKITVKYSEPHRDADGKIIIENRRLFDEDIRKYGVTQAYRWVEQGKYNLTPEELEKEHMRIEEERKQVKKEFQRLYNLLR